MGCRAHLHKCERQVEAGYPSHDAASDTECYIDIDTTVSHTGASATLAFFGQLDETIPNESWAFSNVAITTDRAVAPLQQMTQLDVSSCRWVNFNEDYNRNGAGTIMSCSGQNWNARCGRDDATSSNMNDGSESTYFRWRSSHPETALRLSCHVPSGSYVKEVKWFQASDNDCGCHGTVNKILVSGSADDNGPTWEANPVDTSTGTWITQQVDQTATWIMIQVSTCSGCSDAVASMSEFQAFGYAT